MLVRSLLFSQLLEDVAADNVFYLELRTTPRGHAATGMSAHDYVTAVIRGIQQSEMAGIPVTTRLMLSINRTEPVCVVHAPRA